MRFPTATGQKKKERKKERKKKKETDKKPEPLLPIPQTAVAIDIAGIPGGWLMKVAMKQSERCSTSGGVDEN